MRIALQAEQSRPEVAGAMRHQVQSRVMDREPPRQKIDRQGEPIHLGEQGQDKAREHPKLTPVLLPSADAEARGEKNEEDGIDEDQRPEAIGGFVVAHGWASFCEGRFVLVLLGSPDAPSPWLWPPPCP